MKPPRTPQKAIVDGGFTMMELLVTMVLLTISMTGLAALQVNVVRQTTVSRHADGATRLAQSVIQRYQVTRIGNITTTGGQWIAELQRDGVSQMQNVSVDGETVGPYTVQSLIEASGGTGFLINVRVSWLSATPSTNATTNAVEYITRNVTLSTQRFQ